jgi:hypothetical protein
MKKLIILSAAALTFATTAFAQIGSLSSDLVFTPITPCRIVDTRNAGGAVMAGSTRIFKAWAASYTTQGGSATNCNLLQTNDVAALALNLVVVAPSTDGYITAYPVGEVRPNASTVNYKTNDVLANSATVKVNQTTSDWNLYSLATTHFIADVVGYYSKPVVTALECVTASNTSTTIPANTTINDTLTNVIAAPSCDAGYTKTATSCSFYGNQMVLRKTETSPIGNGSISSCVYDNPAPTAQTVFITATCCRIPGRLLIP